MILGILLACVAALAAPSPRLELVGCWNGGPSYASAISGGYAYFGSGGRVRVLKIDDEEPWVEIGALQTDGVVRDLSTGGAGEPALPDHAP